MSVRGTISMRAAIVVTAVAALTGAASAGAVRSATPDELAAFTNAALAQTPYGDASTSVVVTYAVARVSTVDGRWAVLGMSGTTTAGDPVQGAQWVLWWNGSAWQVRTWGTEIATSCGGARRIGASNAVIDDLRLAPVSYRCAAPPAPMLPCLISRSWGYEVRPVRRPKGCDISVDGTTSPPSASLTRLRGLRWVQLSRTRGVAVGSILPNHWPFVRVPVRVVFTLPVEGNARGPVFSRATITTKYGVFRNRPLGGAR